MLQFRNAGAASPTPAQGTERASASEIERRVVSLSARRWRAALLSVHRAETRYLALSRDPSAPTRTVELAWLDWWRAQRRRDQVLQEREDDVSERRRPARAIPAIAVSSNARLPGSGTGVVSTRTAAEKRPA
jgi:hypothetical protein